MTEIIYLTHRIECSPHNNGLIEFEKKIDHYLLPWYDWHLKVNYVHRDLVHIMTKRIKYFEIFSPHASDESNKLWIEHYKNIIKDTSAPFCFDLEELLLGLVERVLPLALLLAPWLLALNERVLPAADLALPGLLVAFNCRLCTAWFRAWRTLCFWRLGSAGGVL